MKGMINPTSLNSGTIFLKINSIYQSWKILISGDSKEPTLTHIPSIYSIHSSSLEKISKKSDHWNAVQGLWPLNRCDKKETDTSTKENLIGPWTTMREQCLCFGGFNIGKQSRRAENSQKKADLKVNKKNPLDLKFISILKARKISMKGQRKITNTNNFKNSTRNSSSSTTMIMLYIIMAKS